MRLVFAKHAGGVLLPVTPEAFDFLAGLRLEEGVGMDLKKVRNIGFHKKFFALLKLAYQIWQPPQDGPRLDGLLVRKTPQAFRKSVLVLAGHCDASYGVDGSVQLEARSIAWDKCDEIEFAQVYKAVLDVVWERVFQSAGYRDRREMEAIAMRLMDFE